jgi:hypothetical protein
MYSNAQLPFLDTRTYVHALYTTIENKCMAFRLCPYTSLTGPYTSLTSPFTKTIYWHGIMLSCQNI